jgi:bis(5'-nucleosyl)-tetraphosphatase (symmetrical)
MIWAIGDLQGCYNSFMSLLKKINFNFDTDELWLVGDLVNRGRNSLEILEYVYEHRNSIKVVLGNHDIGLIASYYGIKKTNSFIEPIIKSPRVDEYINWLRTIPFLHIGKNTNYCMSHAGIAPIFDLEEAKKWNYILQAKLLGNDVKKWLINLLGNKQDYLNYGVSPEEDEMYAFSSFTRMRYCFEDGRLELENKSSPINIQDITPWFNAVNRKKIEKKIIFGHWSTLGLYQDENVIALDTGCVWEGKLTAFNLDTQAIVSVDCK